MMDLQQNIVKSGGHYYKNGAVYIGSWNDKGLRHGLGHLVFKNGTRYDGYFEDGLFNGLGVLTFFDGAKYEGEFYEGWFHGYGVFWRTDGMRHEGEYRGGKMCGLGKTTFNDGSNGFPKHEGYFDDCKLLKKRDCSEIVQKAHKFSFMARQLMI